MGQAHRQRRRARRRARDHGRPSDRRRNQAARPKRCKGPWHRSCSRSRTQPATWCSRRALAESRTPSGEAVDSSRISARARACAGASRCSTRRATACRARPSGAASKSSARRSSVAASTSGSWTWRSVSRVTRRPQHALLAARHGQQERRRERAAERSNLYCSRPSRIRIRPRPSRVPSRCPCSISVSVVTTISGRVPVTG